MSKQKPETAATPPPAAPEAPVAPAAAEPSTRSKFQQNVESLYQLALGAFIQLLEVHRSKLSDTDFTSLLRYATDFYRIDEDQIEGALSLPANTVAAWMHEAPNKYLRNAAIEAILDLFKAQQAKSEGKISLRLPVTGNAEFENFDKLVAQLMEEAALEDEPLPPA